MKKRCDGPVAYSDLIVWINLISVCMLITLVVLKINLFYIDLQLIANRNIIYIGDEGN